MRSVPLPGDAPERPGVRPPAKRADLCTPRSVPRRRLPVGLVVRPGSSWVLLPLGEVWTQSLDGGTGDVGEVAGEGHGLPAARVMVEAQPVRAVAQGMESCDGVVGIVEVVAVVGGAFPICGSLMRPPPARRPFAVSHASAGPCRRTVAAGWPRHSRPASRWSFL